MRDMVPSTEDRAGNVFYDVGGPVAAHGTSYGNDEDPRRRLYGFQEWALQLLLGIWRGRDKRTTGCLAFPPGTGKTRVAAAFAAEILETPGQRFLVVCPGHLASQTAHQLANYLGPSDPGGLGEFSIRAGEETVSIVVRRHAVRRKAALKPGGAPGDLDWLLSQTGSRVHVISADILTNKNVGKQGVDLKQLVRDGKYGAVLVDEAHRCVELCRRLSEVLPAHMIVWMSASGVRSSGLGRWQLASCWQLGTCLQASGHCRSVVTFSLTPALRERLGMPAVAPLACRLPRDPRALQVYWKWSSRRSYVEFEPEEHLAITSLATAACYCRSEKEAAPAAEEEASEEEASEEASSEGGGEEGFLWHEWYSQAFHDVPAGVTELLQAVVPDAGGSLAVQCGL